jgi:hypothetical protein
MSMSTKPITFSRAKSGWIFRQERTEDVCGFESEFFDVQHLNLVTRKRREHLSAEDVKKNKSIMQKLTSGNIEHEEDMEVIS